MVVVERLKLPEIVGEVSYTIFPVPVTPEGF